MTAWTASAASAMPLAITDFATALVLLPGLVIGLTLHEFAHAWSASLLGDDFARRQGRVSLNPFRHLSLLGTLAIFILPFGWAKPVTVNVYNFRRPRWDYLLSSLAGPAANIAVVLSGLGLMHLTRHTYAFGLSGAGWLGLAHLLLMMIIFINAILAVFNLLPIPPLDGSKIWPVLLGRRITTPGSKTGWIAIIVLILLMRGGMLNGLFDTALGSLTAIAPVADSAIVDDKAKQADQATERGDYAAAETIYGEILAITGDHPGFLYDRASCRLQQGDVDGALADCERVLALPPGTPGLSEVREAMSLLRDSLIATGTESPSATKPTKPPDAPAANR